MFTKQHSPMLLRFGVTVAVLLACTVVAHCKPVVPNKVELDFQTEQASRAAFGKSSFIFNFSKADTISGNSSLKPLFVDGDPALATLPGEGVGQNLVTLGACTINQPHSHPRGTEISHVTKGKLLFGFLEENKGRFISGNVSKGRTAIIPQGLIHFAFNQGCTDAQFIASFPSRDPGTQTTASNFFRLPKSVLRATLGLDEETIKKVSKTAIATTNPSQDPDCLKACGLYKAS